MFKLFIIIHASLGGIALLSGLFSLISKKGNTKHKLFGKVFFFSMLSSILISVIIALMPNHENSFLLAIGVFSAYLILSGYRSIQYKNKDVNIQIDKVCSYIMIIVGVLMIFSPLILNYSINIVLIAFGITGIILATRDLILFKKPIELRKKWLHLHIGKMLGGYISAVTAFVVVNQFFTSIYGWFIPSIIGTFYITYWLRKVKI